MIKGKVFLFGLVLLLVMLPIINAQETKSFEEVLGDYGMKEDMVFDEGNYTSYEVEGIPSYKFVYIVDQEFGTHPVRFILQFFGFWVETKTVRIPAIDMTNEEWLQNAHLFIRPIEEFKREVVIIDMQIKEEEIEEITIFDHNGIPGYRIQPNKADAILYPAIELGFDGGMKKINGKQTFVEYKTGKQLWNLWNGGDFSSTDELDE